MFRSRSRQLEMMDDITLHDDRIAGALREITTINRWLGGNATSRKGIREAIRALPAGTPVTILDVGAGGSDLSDALRPLGRAVQITSLDISRGACEFSARRHPGASVVQGSVLQLPFRDRSFDIVHAGMFLHHFTDEALREVLPGLFAVARHALVVNDLRRSVFAYAGITLLTSLFSGSAMVRNDAPLSVLRGFSRREVERFATPLPGATSSVKRTWAYRWLVCIRKP